MLKVNNSPTKKISKTRVSQKKDEINHLNDSLASLQNNNNIENIIMICSTDTETTQENDNLPIKKIKPGYSRKRDRDTIESTTEDSDGIMNVSDEEESIKLPKAKKKKIEKEVTPR